MPIIHANNIDVHYALEGREQAPVLMLSNSLGTNFSMWDGQAAPFTKHFRLLRYDTRGHGKTSAPDGPYTCETLGRDALGLLDALKIDRVRFCGLSMGGMIGMWLARNAPGRIERLVLCNTAAKFGLPELWNQRIATVRAGGMKAIAQGVLERWFTPVFIAKSPDEVSRIQQGLHTTAPQGYAGNCAAIRDVDQRWTIAGIRAPTLVIGGKQDPATPFAAAELIASRIPGARLTGLDAAHLSNIEQPAAFNDAVGDFLSKG